MAADAQSGIRPATNMRAMASVGVALGMVAVAAVSLRGGLFAQGAKADFALPTVVPGASADGFIDVPRECSSIQVAIDAAEDGITVRVAAGEFVGPLLVDGKSIRIEGAGMGATTIHAFGRGPVVTLRGNSAQRLSLAGMTIADGHGDAGCGLLVDGAPADIHGVRLVRNAGGGAVVRGAAPTFTSCRFDENSGAESGGGLRNEAGSPVLVDCAFVRNVAATFGGAIYSRGGSVNVLDCTIESNSTRSGAWGGAIFGDGSAFEIYGTQFARNRSIEAGGALYMMGGSAEISQCSFTGDFAESARAIFSRGAGMHIVRSTLCGAKDDVMGGDFTAGEGNVFDSECFADCNGNGIADDEEISLGWAQDEDGNGVPDPCDPDCNMNGIPDAYEVQMGWAGDLNQNGLLDSCEIRMGLVNDADRDGIPDELQLPELAHPAAPVAPAAAPVAAPAPAPAPAEAPEPPEDPDAEFRRLLR